MVQRINGVVESRAVLAGGILILALWSLPVTKLVYNPKHVEISGAKVTVYRTFPGDALGLPRPMISYVETVRPMSPTHNKGVVCSDAKGPFKYGRATEIGEWNIDWAQPCLSDPIGYHWSAHWYWNIGSFKLGPVDLGKTILKLNP